MRIVRSIGSGDSDDRLHAEIVQAVRPPCATGRICGDACAMICAQCGATTCQCACSPDCPDAAIALSSDPQAHPIEPGIVALVYAMTRIGLFAPCWSCEGHARADGSLWKLPTVWFYCDAMAHLRLLADGLARLTHARRLHAVWRVVVTFSDADNPRTTFALEPAVVLEGGATLQQLQGDAAEIGRSLQLMIVEGGQALGRATGSD
jgi:hypothetical protein